MSKAEGSLHFALTAQNGPKHNREGALKRHLDVPAELCTVPLWECLSQAACFPPLSPSHSQDCKMKRGTRGKRQVGGEEDAELELRTRKLKRALDEQRVTNHLAREGSIWLAASASKCQVLSLLSLSPGRQTENYIAFSLFYYSPFLL